MTTATQFLGGILSADARALDVLAHNVANANTPGYKRQVWLSHLDALSLAESASSAIDVTPGNLQQSHDLRHVAIDGPGFFEVTTATGTAYTRRGDFTLDAHGYLALATGQRVQGEAGNIALMDNLFAIRPDGTVWQGDTAVAQLKLVALDPDSLRSAGSGGLFHGQPLVSDGELAVSLLPGFIEGSNVDVAAELVRLYALTRHFETAARFVGLYGEMSDSLSTLLDLPA